MVELEHSGQAAGFQGDPPALYTRLLCLAFLVCFFVGQVFFGSYGAVATSVIAIFALPIFLWSGPRKRLLQNKLILLFPLAFVLLLIAFIITAEDISDVKYIFNFTSFAMTLPIVALASHYKGANWVLYVATAALIGIICAFGISVYQVYFLGAGRAGGFVSNANTLAHVTLIFALFPLAGIYPFSSKWRMLFLLGPILALAVLMMTESRGALLSVLPVLLFSFAYLGHKKGVRRWIFAASMASVVLLGAALTYSSLLDGPMARFAAGSKSITTVLEGGQANDWGTYMRIELYKGATRAFLESPIVGHGWQDAVFEAAQEIEGIYPKNNMENSVIAARWPTMHNDFLAFAAGAGLFGIASFILVLLAPVLAARRRGAFFAQRLYIGASLVSMTVIHGLVNAPFGHGISIMTYAYVAAILIGGFHAADQPFDDSSSASA